MGDLFLFFPIIVVLIFGLVIGPILAKTQNKTSSRTNSKSRSAGEGYNRSVDPIHITSDAASERRRRLDQLQSLYESGMMERDEYLERCASVDEDYRGNYRR